MRALHTNQFNQKRTWWPRKVRICRGGPSETAQNPWESVFLSWACGHSLSSSLAPSALLKLVWVLVSARTSPRHGTDAHSQLQVHNPLESQMERGTLSQSAQYKPWLGSPWIWFGPLPPPSFCFCSHYSAFISFLGANLPCKMLFLPSDSSLPSGPTELLTPPSDHG